MTRHIPQKNTHNRRAHMRGTRISFSVQEANRKLRKENERLRMEREILKKATAFCAREQS